VIRISAAWRRRRIVVLLAAAALLLLAVLSPDVVLRRQVPQVIVVLDVTQSMNTPDCRLDDAAEAVSRLACVKSALADALRDLPCGAQLAWGVFSGNQTFVLAAPLEVCAYRGDLLDSLARLDWRITWDAGSRVGGGLVSALRLLPSVPHAGDAETIPGLVFITDGHEAPPVSLRNRRRADDYAGKVQGVVVGVGGDALTAIPKYDMDGKYLGDWGADDVPQADMGGRRALSSVPGEKMVGEEDEVPTGTEHLSSLKEPYLQILAQDARLEYRRLARRADMAAILQSASVRRTLPIDTDVRWIPAAAALLLLLIA
jgi:mxaL protein